MTIFSQVYKRSFLSGTAMQYHSHIEDIQPVDFPLVCTSCFRTISVTFVLLYFGTLVLWYFLFCEDRFYLMMMYSDLSSFSSSGFFLSYFFLYFFVQFYMKCFLIILYLSHRSNLWSCIPNLFVCCVCVDFLFNGWFLLIDCILSGTI